MNPDRRSQRALVLAIHNRVAPPLSPGGRPRLRLPAPGGLCSLAPLERRVAVQYVSTRGEAPKLAFEDVVLAGLAADGGLYVPEAWPRLSSQDFGTLRGLSYGELAIRVMEPYVRGALPEAYFGAIVEGTYLTFSDKRIAPMRQNQRQRMAARAVSWPHARLQGLRAPAPRPAVRLLSQASRRAHDRDRGDLGRYGLGCHRGVP